MNYAQQILIWNSTRYAAVQISFITNSPLVRSRGARNSINLQPNVLITQLRLPSTSRCYEWRLIHFTDWTDIIV